MRQPLSPAFSQKVAHIFLRYFGNRRNTFPSVCVYISNRMFYPRMIDAEGGSTVKALFYAIPLCLALLTSCAQPQMAAPDPVSEGTPLLGELDQLETVIYRDFDETWYVMQSGDRGFSQVESALSQLQGKECEDPDLTGCYDFSYTAGDTTHDLVFTSDDQNGYACLDGTWYQTAAGAEQSLVKLLLKKGDPIPKEQWIHNPSYVSLDVLLRNNKGLSADEQTVCYAEAPYAYSADIPMETLIKSGTLPELSGYTSSYSLGQYQADGTLWSYTAGWHYESDDPSEYQQLTLTIWAEKPENPEEIDGMLLFEPSKLTKTELIDPHGQSVRVYGDGTTDSRVSRLIFTLPSGAYCQIIAFHTVDPDDTMAVLRSLIQTGFDPKTYAAQPLPDSTEESAP